MNRMAHTNTGELVDAFAHYCQHYDPAGEWDLYPKTKYELVKNIKLGIANMDFNPEPYEYISAVADAILQAQREAAIARQSELPVFDSSEAATRYANYQVFKRQQEEKRQAAEAERTEREVCHGPEDAIASDDPMAPYNPEDYLTQDEED